MIAQSAFSAAPYGAQRQAFHRAGRKEQRALVQQIDPCEVEFAGVRMWVDPRDNYTERRIWMDGQPPEMKSLIALVDRIEGRNAFVLDIGANCGAFTVPLAMAGGPGSRVIAFEPNPEMTKRLARNVALNGLEDRVQIEPYALGDAAGEAMLNFRRRNFGQASLRPIPKGARDGGMLVPVRPLADFTALADTHEVSLLKIDVEGAEEAVLQPLLNRAGWRPDAMLVETKHGDHWTSDLTAQILKGGYEIRMKVEGNTLFTRVGQKR